MWCSKILVAYDGSRSSKIALDLAVSIAEQDSRIEIIAVHVMRLYISGSAAVGMDTIIVDDATDVADELERRLEAIPNPTELRIVKGTSPAEIILRCAEEEQCDLIIMGSRGQGGVKGYLGSVSYGVVQGAQAKVLIAKDAALGGTIG